MQMMQWMLHGVNFLKEDLQMSEEQVLMMLQRYPDVLFADSTGNNLVESFVVLQRIMESESSAGSGGNGRKETAASTKAEDRKVLLSILAARPQLLCDVEKLSAAVECLQSIGKNKRVVLKSQYIRPYCTTGVNYW